MKTIKGQGLVHDTDGAKFPDGTIVDETELVAGTPVVRALYGDIITNIYAILRSVNIVPNEVEDTETGTHQLVDALKIFYNKLNDLEQLLTVDILDINMSVDFDHLPSNYIFIGKLTEDILASNTYVLNSAGANSYNATTSKDITASSAVLIVLNPAGSKIISLETVDSLDDSLKVAFGTPLTFNSSNSLLYYSVGNVFNDFPKNYFVENIIQVAEGTVDIKITDVIVVKGKLVCFTFNDVLLKYQAFSFDISNLSALEGEIALPDFSGVDNQPYIFSDGEFIYFSNSQTEENDSVNDYDFGKFSFDSGTLIISNVSVLSVDANFEKTTNQFIDKDNNLIYTFINGELYSYPLIGTARNLIDNFQTINGVVFKFNGQTYYSNGNLAIKWNY